MPATARIMVYVEPDLKAELERIAELEGRTVSGLLRHLAAEYVRQATEGSSD